MSPTMAMTMPTAMYAPTSDVMDRHEYGITKSRKSSSTGGGRAWSEDEVRGLHRVEFPGLEQGGRDGGHVCYGFPDRQASLVSLILFFVFWCLGNPPE